MADLPNNPNNREEEYLADIAGLPNEKPDNPWSRKEAYLDAISGRMDGLDEKIAALATDISLKGGVESYDDLPEDAEIGDAYITEDTGILYVWVGDEWTPLNMQGGGGIKVLTEADNNYPENNPASIAAWLLEPGDYIVTPVSASTSVRGDVGYYCVRNVDVGQSLGFSVFPAGTRYASSANRQVIGTAMMVENAYYTVPTPFIGYQYIGTSSYDDFIILTTGSIADNLQTNASNKALSAKQGIILHKLTYPMPDKTFYNLWEEA